jgi:hypothetical protein
MQAVPGQSTPVWLDSRTAIISAVLGCFTTLGSYASISFPNSGQLPTITEILLCMALVLILAWIFWMALPPRLRMIANLHEQTDTRLTEGNSKGSYCLNTKGSRLKDFSRPSESLVTYYWGKPLRFSSSRLPWSSCGNPKFRENYAFTCEQPRWQCQSKSDCREISITRVQILGIWGFGCSEAASWECRSWR